jgi:hypothetical protein
MGVSGQHHAPAALYRRGKGPPVHIGQEAGWAPEPVWMQGLEEKSSALVGDRTPVVQSTVRHYTDWAKLTSCAERDHVNRAHIPTLTCDALIACSVHKWRHSMNVY